MGASKLLVATLALAVQTAEPLPRTEGETASGRKVILPDVLQGHVGTLIVGFTKASASTAKAWETCLRRRYGADPGVVVARVAVLAGVPGILRGLVRRLAKGQEPPALQDSFLLLFQSGDDWKHAAGFDAGAGDDAYLLVVDRGGRIRWRAHASRDPLEGRDGGADPLGQLEGQVRAVRQAP